MFASDSVGAASTDIEVRIRVLKMVEDFIMYTWRNSFIRYRNVENALEV
jgi:hypothetical protein